MNGELTSDYFKSQTGIIHPIEKGLGGSRAHQQTLNILSDVFERQKDNYRYFLFLDCDAFPIRKDWLPILVAKMEEQKAEIAAIVRPENCELRLHASILLAKPEALSNLNFIVSEEAGFRLDGTGIT
jgi:hypothetical protein